MSVTDTKYLTSITATGILTDI